MIPTSEQPYPLPERWQWIQVGSLVKIFRGVSYKKSDAHDKKQSGDCLIIRGGNITEGNITTNSSDNIFINKNFVTESQLIKQNDIIIVASTGSKKVIGRAGISNQTYPDVSFGAFLMLVRPLPNVNPRYVDYFFQSNFYRNRIRNLAKGTNINNIRTEHITDMPIPLPSLDEQQRIVALLDELFGKLDEAKALAQAVVDGSISYTKLLPANFPSIGATNTAQPSTAGNGVSSAMSVKSTRQKFRHKIYRTTWKFLSCRWRRSPTFAGKSRLRRKNLCAKLKAALPTSLKAT